MLWLEGPIHVTKVRSHNSIGNLRNPLQTFKIPHKYSHTMGWTINPFILQKLIFYPLKFHPLDFFSECPTSFLNRRMGLSEWMAWMWFAHDHTSFIHSASITWGHVFNNSTYKVQINYCIKNRNKNCCSGEC